jgi:hypothetical protein
VSVEKCPPFSWIILGLRLPNEPGLYLTELRRDVFLAFMLVCAVSTEEDIYINYFI